MKQPHSRNAGLIPSNDLPPDNSTYRKHYQRNRHAGIGSTIGVVTLDEWWKRVHYDLWQVCYDLWGPATCAEFPCQVILTAYQHGLDAFGRGTDVNPYDSGGEAVAWLRGYYKANQIPRPAQSSRAATQIVSFLTIQHIHKAKRRKIRMAKNRRLAALNRQATHSINEVGITHSESEFDDLPPEHSINYLLGWFGLIVDQCAYYVLFVHWRFKTIPNEVCAFGPWDWKPHWKLRDEVYAIRSTFKCTLPGDSDYGLLTSNEKTWADYMFPVML